MSEIIKLVVKEGDFTFLEIYDEDGIRQLKAKIAELKNELAKAHKQIQVDQSRIEQLEGELAVAKETIQAQITIGANYEKQIASLKSEVDVLTSCRNHWKISYVELKKALRDLAGIETSRATNNSPVSKEAK
jgi:chromosome segregation ATPase